MIIKNNFEQSCKSNLMTIIRLIQHMTTFTFTNLYLSITWNGRFKRLYLINDITKPLKDNGISVFVLSTFNTDYLFVKEEYFDRAIDIYKFTDNIMIKEK